MFELSIRMHEIMSHSISEYPMSQRDIFNVKRYTGLNEKLASIMRKGIHIIKIMNVQDNSILVFDIVSLGECKKIARNANGAKFKSWYRYTGRTKYSNVHLSRTCIYELHDNMKNRSISYDSIYIQSLNWMQHNDDGSFF